MSIKAPHPPQLQIQHLPIGDLHPDPANPRVHTRKQVKQIARSIEAFGFNVPVLVDGQNRVVAGHGRLLACKELGWSEVPVISLAHLSESQAKAFLIADNRLTEIATWDDRLLAEQLKALSEVDLDFSLEATGFDMGEIDFRIEGLSPLPEDEPDPADEVPAIEEEAVSRPGDLWILGPHRVICGSALSREDMDRLMGSETAAQVFTDPPYNVPIDGHVTGLGKVRHREFAMACGEMSQEGFTQFLVDALGNAARVSRSGAIHYVCMDWRHLEELLSAGRKVYSGLLNLCVWAKDNAGMGSLYRSQHELVLVFKHGKDAHQNHVQLGVHGRYRSNVWNYPGVNSFGRNTEEGNLLALHPTVKPVALVADAMLDTSSRGDIVLDPFLGSGTSLMAAERVGRVFRGVELDPCYVDTAIRRWQAWTGEAAVLDGDGSTFLEVTAQRRAAEVESHG